MLFPRRSLKGRIQDLELPPISLHTKEKKGKKNKSIIMALCCGSVKIFTPVQPALPGKHSIPSDFID